MYYTDRDGAEITLWLQGAIEEKICNHFKAKVIEAEYPDGPYNTTHVRTWVTSRGNKLVVNWYVSESTKVAAKKLKSGKFELLPLEALAIAVRDYL